MVQNYEKDMKVQSVIRKKTQKNFGVFAFFVIFAINKT